MRVVANIPEKIRSIVLLLAKLDEDAQVIQSRKKVTTIIMSNGEHVIGGKWPEEIIKEHKNRIKKKQRK